jgi:pilus assembly protein Flp/PilA
LSLTEADPEQGSSQTVVQKETTMTKFFARFAKDESGATAIEYGLIAALIAVVAIAGMQAIGTNLLAKFQEVATNLL